MEAGLFPKVCQHSSSEAEMEVVAPPGWCATHVSDLSWAAPWQLWQMPVITMLSDDYFYPHCRYHNWKGKWRRVNLWSYFWRYVSPAISLCKWWISTKIKLLICSYSRNNLGTAFHLSKAKREMVFSQNYNLLVLARADSFSESTFWSATLSPSSYVLCLRLSSTSSLSLPKWRLMVTHGLLQTSHTHLCGQDPRNAEVD